MNLYQLCESLHAHPYGNCLLDAPAPVIILFSEIRTEIAKHEKEIAEIEKNKAALRRK